MSAATLQKTLPFPPNCLSRCFTHRSSRLRPALTASRPPTPAHYLWPLRVPALHRTLALFSSCRPEIQVSLCQFRPRLPWLSSCLDSSRASLATTTSSITPTPVIPRSIDRVLLGSRLLSSRPDVSSSYVYNYSIALSCWPFSRCFLASSKLLMPSQLQNGSEPELFRPHAGRLSSRLSAELKGCMCFLCTFLKSRLRTSLLAPTYLF